MAPAAIRAPPMRLWFGRCGRRPAPHRASGSSGVTASNHSPATHIPGAKRWPIRPLLRGKEAGVPVTSTTVIGRPGGDVSAGCQWLIAAAEMAGVAPCDWFASPGGDALEWARSPITVQTLNMDPEAVRAGRELSIAALR